MRQNNTRAEQLRLQKCRKNSEPLAAKQTRLTKESNPSFSIHAEKIWLKCQVGLTSA